MEIKTNYGLHLESTETMTSESIKLLRGCAKHATCRLRGANRVSPVARRLVVVTNDQTLDTHIVAVKQETIMPRDIYAQRDLLFQLHVII